MRGWVLHSRSSRGTLVGRSCGLVGSRGNSQAAFGLLLLNLFTIVNPGTHRPTRARRVLLLALCALVFSFALHAKTGVYGNGIPVKVTPSTAAKLWLNGQKMEVRPVTSSPSALLFCIALLLIYRLYLHRKPRVPTALCLPAARHLSLWHSHRFLRPPPVRP